MSKPGIFIIAEEFLNTVPKNHAEMSNTEAICILNQLLESKHLTERSELAVKHAIKVIEEDNRRLALLQDILNGNTEVEG